MMKSIIFYFTLSVSTLLSTLVSFDALSEQQTDAFSDAELAQMLAPIALYPDSLLTHILIASTYPIEVIEAHRWLKKNTHIEPNKINELTEEYDWDASVKALIPFERVLARLSEELSWTQALGDAFLQDESRLLAEIQKLRIQANEAGSLEKMDNMDIRYEDNNIAIVPTEREVIYVPYYDSRRVYGRWHWAAYPPVYWQSNHYNYVSHYSPFYWHNGVHISFNYFFSAFHWQNRQVIVVNPRSVNHRYYHQRPRRLIANGGYSKRWYHKPAHRKGVAYHTKTLRNKYHSKRVKVNRRPKQLHTNNRGVTHSTYRSKQLPQKSHYKKTHTVRQKKNSVGKHKVVKVNKTKERVYATRSKYDSHSKPRKVRNQNASSRLKASNENQNQPLMNKKTAKSNKSSVGHKATRKHDKNDKKTNSKSQPRTVAKKIKNQVNKDSGYKIASTKRFQSNKRKEKH